MSGLPITRPTIRGHVHGFALADEAGGLIDVFPTLAGAEKASHAACAALVQLAAVFAKAGAK